MTPIEIQTSIGPEFCRRSDRDNTAYAHIIRFGTIPHYSLYVGDLHLTTKELEDLLKENFSTPAEIVSSYENMGMNRGKFAKSKDICFVVGDATVMLEYYDGNGPSGNRPIAAEANDEEPTVRTNSITVVSHNKETIERFSKFAEEKLQQYIKAVSTKKIINLITRNEHGVSLTPVTLADPTTSIDTLIEQNYNDDFKTFNDHVVRSFTSLPKGIVLLHGTPGTGKTSYIRSLIHQSTRPCIYVPNEMARQLADPTFLTLLRGSPNSVLMIEDAEDVLMTREAGGNAAVSNILNLCDGILSDVLRITVVATFNRAITDIDKALLRKGRLIGQYEFKPLTVEKSKQLMKKLHGDDAESSVTKAMTLGDIYSYGEKEFLVGSNKTGIGF